MREHNRDKIFKKEMAVQNEDKSRKRSSTSNTLSPREIHINSTSQ